MNLIQCKVTEILSKPYEEYNKWFIKVSFESYGREGSTTIMFSSEDDAKEVRIGYKFLN